jgi:hypothetical protein
MKVYMIQREETGSFLKVDRCGVRIWCTQREATVWTDERLVNTERNFFEPIYYDLVVRRFRLRPCD